MLSSTSAQNSLDDTFGCEEAIFVSFSGLISEGSLFVACFGSSATVRFAFTFAFGAGIRLGGHGMEMAGMTVGLCLLARKVARKLSGRELPVS